MILSLLCDHPQIPTITEHLAQAAEYDTSTRIVTEARNIGQPSPWLVPAQPSAS